MEYFKRLQELLKIERREDEELYRKLIEKSSVSERRANGLAWYPITIRGSEMGRGDYLTIEVERTTHHEIIHQLRFGIPAALFSHHDPKMDRVEGVIAHVNGNNLKITLRIDELPDWADNGKLGIDLLFDDNSYDEMTASLKQAAFLAENEKEGRLVRILTGQIAPAFDEKIISLIVPSLNTSQLAAVEKIVSARDLAIVHGPPGTGKTTTLVQAIKILINNGEKQILVVAPSNTAVDLLSEKLSLEGVNVLRIGNSVRVSERLLSLTLDSKMAAHSRMKDIRKLKKQANEYRNMAHKYKRTFGKAEREQRKALFDEAYKIMKEVNNTEQYIMDDVVSKAQVLAATLIGSNHYTIRKLKFNIVVIDEAGQSLEPAAWVPAIKANKLIMAGDHFQLPPTIKSFEAAKKGLSITLLEKAVALHPEAVVLLDEQYRMNTSIMGYSSKVFYQDKLKAHGSVADHVLFPGDASLAFIDTAGCGFDEKMEGTSSTNPEEAAFLMKQVRRLVNELKSYYTITGFPTIAIISPYKRQVDILKELFLHNPDLVTYSDKIAVNTIDSFQGQERDVVFISMTRSNSEGDIGFLSDTRRMNVAMTRARKKLLVIGDSATLSKLPFYLDFINYAEGLDAYQSAWSLMEDIDNPV
ncbi:MAG: AAA domain-containing protein [Flavitalea sp.]